MNRCHTSSSLAAGAGDITFASTIDGTQDLSLTTTGNILFGAAAGGTARLGNVTIVSADDVTGTAMRAASFTQTAGTGDTEFTGTIDTTGNVDLSTAGNLGTGVIAYGGTLDLAGASGLILNGDITGGGAATFASSGGTIAPAGSRQVTTVNGTVTFENPLEIGADLTVNSGSGDIAFDAAVDGPGDLDLTTTGGIGFGGAAGGTVRLGDVTLNTAADVSATDTLNANSLTQTGGTGTTTFDGTVDTTADLDIATAGAVTFNDAVTYGGVLSVDAGASDIAFNGTINGAGDATIITTNDISFAGDVGGVTRLGDVFIDPRHVTAAGLFRVGSFILTNGTGNVNFMNLDSTGGVSIATNGNILGTYLGVNGALDAGAGSITGTVSFSMLDIGGSGATLNAGYIGAPNVADQGMANLISIDGQHNPWPMGIPNPAYTFAGFQIGAPVPTPGGASHDGGTPPPNPITPTDPLPPLEEPQTLPPMTEHPDSAPSSFIGDLAGVERSIRLPCTDSSSGGASNGIQESSLCAGGYLIPRFFYTLPLLPQ